MDDFTDRIAFITGGASGIGLALARAFSSAGANLVLADINGPRLEEVVLKFNRDGTEALGVELNVADIESWKSARAQTEDRFGGIDILCNNAGVAPANLPFEQISDEDWNWIVGVNLNGIRNGIATWLPAMKRAGRPGHIINTASVLGLFATANAADYVACKYAVVGMSEALHMELSDTLIEVSVICPGFVETPLAADREVHKRLSGIVSTLSREPSSRIGDRAALLPDRLGTDVLNALRSRQFLILPQPEYARVIDSKYGRIRREYGLCDATGEDVAALGGGELGWHSGPSRPR
ncbi:SDR family oxidoreductase [Ochrobactrum quorumnocens]|nr:SDR family NAD(P)-dependent oxidoreductase [[Ochrobactrum] quorumnocens]